MPQDTAGPKALRSVQPPSQDFSDIDDFMEQRRRPTDDSSDIDAFMASRASLADDFDQFMQERQGQSKQSDFDSFMQSRSKEIEGTKAKQKSENALDEITSGKNPITQPIAGAPASLDLGPAPRSVAEGLATEQREQSAGAPLKLKTERTPLNSTVLSQPETKAQPVADRMQLAQPEQPTEPHEVTSGVGAQIASQFLTPVTTPTLGEERDYTTAEQDLADAAEAERQGDAERAHDLRVAAAIKQHPYAQVAKAALGIVPSGEGLGEAGAGVADVVGGKNLNERLEGGARTIGGAMTLLTPEFASGLMEAPVQVGTGLLTGMAAGQAARKGVELAGGSPEAQDLAEQVGFFIPSAVGLRYRYAEAPNGNGEAAGVSAFGGKVKAGVARTPDAYRGQVNIGSTKLGVEIPRGGEPVEAAPKEPAPQIAPPVSALASESVNTMRDGIQAAAAANAADNLAAGGIPPQPQPTVEQAPPLTDDVLKGISSTIQAAPKEARGQLVAEAHGNLATALLQQGKVMLGGKLYVVENEKQASNVATKLINDEVARLDKEAAKEPTEKGAAAEAPAETKTEAPTTAETAVPADFDQFMAEQHGPTDFDQFMQDRRAAPQYQKGDVVRFVDNEGRDRTGTIRYVHPQGLVVRLADETGHQIEIGPSRLRGRAEPAKTVEVSPSEPKYKFGNTQASIEEGSEAGKALNEARAAIPEEHLMGDGRDVGGNHVTVRYGIKGEDNEGIRKYIESQAPFEATLGATSTFPPSEHSDNAVPVIAPVEAPELHRINAEIEKHGEFTEPSFPEYKPHATVAYVKPEVADQYKGNKATEGKKFKVSSIAITDRNGNETEVPLKGKRSQSPASPPEPSSPATGAMRADVWLVPPEKIEARPDLFQWRTLPRQSGLENAKHWNKDAAGELLLWKNPEDGKTYLVDGHHRLALAKRLGVGKVKARYLDASDIKSARIAGAIINIAQGNAEPLDVAKFFRDSGLTAEYLESQGVSLSGKAASAGRALANLSDRLWREYLSGGLSEPTAVAIGSTLGDPAMQKALADIAKTQKLSAAEVEQMGPQIARQGATEQSIQTLFGEDTAVLANAVARARVAAKIEKRLTEERNVLRYVSKESRAKIISQAKGIIDTKAADQAAMLRSGLVEVFKKLANRSGEISDILDDAGRRITAGESQNVVENQAYHGTLETLQRVLAGAGGSGRASVQETAGAKAPRGAGENGAQEPTIGSQTLSSLEPAELTSWAGTGNLRIEPAGEQLGLLGDSEVAYFLVKPSGARQLVLSRELQRLVSLPNVRRAMQAAGIEITEKRATQQNDEPFALTAPGSPTRNQQPTLYGPNDVGEIIGNKRSANVPRSQSKSKSPLLFRSPGKTGEAAQKAETAKFARWKYYVPEGPRPGFLVVNREGLDILRSAIGGRFNGTSIDPILAEATVRVLRANGESLKGQFLARKNLMRLAAAVKAATAKDTGLMIVQDDGSGELKPDPITLKEELFHAMAQRRPGGGDVYQGVPHEVMRNDRLLKRAMESARREGYPDNPVVLVAEAFYDVIDGMAPISEADSDTVAERYWRAFADKLGAEQLRVADQFFELMENASDEYFGDFVDEEREYVRAARNTLQRVRQNRGQASPAGVGEQGGRTTERVRAEPNLGWLPTPAQSPKSDYVVPRGALGAAGTTPRSSKAISGSGEGGSTQRAQLASLEPSEGTAGLNRAGDKQHEPEETVMGMGAIPIPAEQVKNFYNRDVAPTLQKAGINLRSMGALFAEAFWPRAEESSLAARALGVAAPRAAVDAIMAMKGDRDQMLASFDLATNALEKFFDRLPESQRIDFIDRIMQGKPQPTPTLQNVQNGIIGVLREVRKEEKRYKDFSDIENYFPLRWKVIPGSQAEKGGSGKGRGGLQGSRAFAKQKTIPDASTGMKAGGKLETTNPVRLMRQRLEEGVQFVTARRMWEQLDDLGLKKFIGPHEPTPDGYEDVNDSIAKTYFPVQVLKTDIEGATHTIKGMDVVHVDDIETKNQLVQGGRWVVEANSARLIKNFLSPDPRAGKWGPIVRPLMWLKNASTALELGLSPFHAVFETIEANSSQMALGMLRLWNQGVRQGDLGALAEGLKDIATSPVAFVSWAKQGAALPAYIAMRSHLHELGIDVQKEQLQGSPAKGVREALMQWNELRKQKAVKSLLKQYPDLDHLTDLMFKGGITIGQHRDYQVKTLQTIRENWTANNPIGAVLRSIPTATQSVMKPLFQWYIPNLKYAMFLKQFTQQRAERTAEIASGKLTELELARKVADSVENRFGELNFDNLFWRRSLKTGLQFAFRSVTWKLGNVREFGGAGLNQAREFAEWLHILHEHNPSTVGLPMANAPKQAGGESKKTAGEKALPRLDMKSSWFLAMLMTAGIMGTIASKLLSKRYPWEWAKDEAEDFSDFVKRMYLETVHPRSGDVDFRGKPTRISLPTYIKDMEHVRSDPSRWVMGSTSTTLSKAIDIAQNRDYFGNFVYDPNAPFWKRQEQKLRYGFPAPFIYSNFASGKELASDREGWLAAFGFVPASKSLDFTPAEQKLADILQSKKTPFTPDEVEAFHEDQAALDNGTATPQQIRKAAKDMATPWIVKMFRRQEIEYPEALDIYNDLASPDEQLLLRPYLERKRAALLKRNPERVHEAERLDQ